MSELCSQYEVHRIQIINWKKFLLEGVQRIFAEKLKKKNDDQQKLIEELYRQVGQLKVENDWLKKKFDVFHR